MFRVTSETMIGCLVQHIESSDHELTVCHYEEALKAGLEPESGTTQEGCYWVDFCASPDILFAVSQAAQQEVSDRRTNQRSSAAQPSPKGVE